MGSDATGLESLNTRNLDEDDDDFRDDESVFSINIKAGGAFGKKANEDFEDDFDKKSSSRREEDDFSPLMEDIEELSSGRMSNITDEKSKTLIL